MRTKAINWNKVATVAGVSAALILLAGDVLAQATGGTGGSGGGTNLGTLAQNITGSFQQIGALILAISFVGGLGFTMAAIFKFKQHKDNPTQIPLGTPIAMLAIGIVLMFLPGIISPAGQTLFGASATSAAGGFTGSGTSALPGTSGTSNP